jgi:hypothetical protein
MVQDYSILQKGSHNPSCNFLIEIHIGQPTSSNGPKPTNSFSTVSFQGNAVEPLDTFQGHYLPIQGVTLGEFLL